MDASEIWANAKEVSTSMIDEKFMFPITDGTVKNWRTSGPGNIHINPGSPRPRRRT